MIRIFGHDLIEVNYTAYDYDDLSLCKVGHNGLKKLRRQKKELSATERGGGGGVTNPFFKTGPIPKNIGNYETICHFLVILS